jgi:hypothetical protein
MDEIKRPVGVRVELVGQYVKAERWLPGPDFPGVVRFEWQCHSERVLSILAVLKEGTPGDVMGDFYTITTYAPGSWARVVAEF